MRTLKDIADVPWSEKAVASGRAGHIPKALAGMVSPDQEVRNRSYWQLDNEVVLQSDLFEAAYFIIPFLVQFLDEKVADGRDRIYDLLYEIGNGYAPATVKVLTAVGDFVPLIVACARELKKARDVFLRDTNDGDPVVSEKAKELMELLATKD